MRKKVLLVKPFGAADEVVPPTSLGMLAAHLKEPHDVTILDALKEGAAFDKVASAAAEGGFDVVGFQCYSKDAAEVKKTCKRIKELSPSTITIAGGIHPTALAHTVLDYFGPSLDYAYSGEGELGFKDFVDSLEDGGVPFSAAREIPGLIWREKGSIRVNPNTFSADLDVLGHPAWELIAPDSYPEAPHGAFYRQFPVAPIILTRGCPFPCTFCSAPMASGARLRQRSVEGVIEELKLLKHSFNVREFHIEDDNFTLDTAYVERFCESLLGSGLGFTWSLPNGVRLDTVTRPLLALMKRAGCYAVNFGVESGSDRILKAIRKQMTTGDIAERLEMVHGAGMEVGAFFIIGFPGETEADIEETIRFALALPIEMVGVSYFQPLPGTPIYQELVKSGEINGDAIDFSNMALHSISYVPRTLTTDKLRYYRRRLLRSFYLRPVVFKKTLMQARSATHLYYMIKRGVRWLGS